VAVDVEPIRAQQLWHAVADRMRAEILSGELRGGSKLIETELAERFGTSRGPVREAMRELAREGLVVEIPRRGTVVSTLSARDLAEVYAVREALETGASKAAIANARDDELDELRTHLDALERSWAAGAAYLESSVHDLSFHRALVALAGNQRMSAMYDQMLTQTRLLLRLAAEENPTLREGMKLSAHRDVLAALAARDPRAAEGAIAAHYRYAEERLFGGTAL
jgi:DNA-binding GntR family transcriptional regulator